MIELDPAILAYILAEPDEDDHRIIAAEWWDDHEESDRAEFVRVQLELARLEPDTPENCKPAWATLSRRERELTRNGVEQIFWAADLPCSGSPENGTVWRRGFIEGIACPWGHWQENASKILTRQPVRKVVLTTRPPLTGELLSDCWPSVVFDLPRLQGGHNATLTVGTGPNAPTFDILQWHVETPEPKVYRPRNWLQDFAAQHGLPQPK